MTDLDALRALVAKSTPGPWKVILSPHGPRYNCVQYGEDQNYTSLEMEPGDAALIVAAVNALPALLDELAAARRDAEDIRRAGEILADAPGLPLELLDEKELSKWTDAITGLVILFTDAIDAARGER